MNSKGYSISYWFAFMGWIIAVIGLISTIMASAAQPAIYLASVVLVYTCVAFVMG
jgi:hypothetical protein